MQCCCGARGNAINTALTLQHSQRCGSATSALAAMWCCCCCSGTHVMWCCHCGSCSKIRLPLRQSWQCNAATAALVVTWRSLRSTWSNVVLLLWHSQQRGAPVVAMCWHFQHCGEQHLWQCSAAALVARQCCCCATCTTQCCCCTCGNVLALAALW